MTINAIQRDKIIAALLAHRKNFTGNEGQFAKMMGINPSIWSLINAGKKSKGLIKDDTLITIGRRLNVALMDAPEWKIVQTETFQFITDQLSICQRESAARILCDMAGIGKTTAAKQYMLSGKNVFYVDCSQFRNLKEFIKALAKAMGVSINNKLQEIIGDIMYFLNSIHKPLVILDEFADLEYRAFIEVKSLWNGTEGNCGWYAMGADGLKHKIERGIAGKRVGFVEFFRRFGEVFMTVRPPMNDADKQIFVTEHAAAIVHANMPGATVHELLPVSERIGTIYSLTRLKERIIKIKRDAA